MKNGNFNRAAITAPGVLLRSPGDCLRSSVVSLRSPGVFLRSPGVLLRSPENLLMSLEVLLRSLGFYRGLLRCFLAAILVLHDDVINFYPYNVIQVIGCNRCSAAGDEMTSIGTFGLGFLICDLWCHL